MAYQTIPPSGSPPIGSNVTWPREQYAFLKAAIPQLTAFQYEKIGQFPMGSTTGTSTANNGAAEGGGRTGTNATVTMFGASIFHTCNTTRWAFSIRAKFLAASVGQTNAIGLFNGNGTHDILIGAIASISTANYGLALDGTTSTTDDLGVANDLGFHTFALTGDTANVKAYIDGTLVGTRAIGTNVVDEPMYPTLFNTLSTEAVWTEFLYGYVTV
jgi:hypothetical protein